MVFNDCYTCKMSCFDWCKTKAWVLWVWCLWMEIFLIFHNWMNLLRGWMPGRSNYHILCSIDMLLWGVGIQVFSSDEIFVTVLECMAAAAIWWCRSVIEQLCSIIDIFTQQRRFISQGSRSMKQKMGLCISLNWFVWTLEFLISSNQAS